MWRCRSASNGLLTMKKLFAIAACAVSLAGCVSGQVKETKGPDGELIKVTKCNQSPSGCYEAASKSCDGSAYYVLASESHAGGLLADIVPGPVTWYSMTYRCGVSGGPMPKFPFGGPVQQMPEVRQPTQTNCTTFNGAVSCTTY